MARALVSQSEAQRRLRRDTPIEALSRECSALPFCHIQPGALFKTPDGIPTSVRAETLLIVRHRRSYVLPAGVHRDSRDVERHLL
jgi:hypothetical protein